MKSYPIDDQSNLVRIVLDTIINITYNNVFYS